jgi:AraC-like DNA-binding protein
VKAPADVEHRHRLRTHHYTLRVTRWQGILAAQIDHAIVVGHHRCSGFCRPRWCWLASRHHSTSADSGGGSRRAAQLQRVLRLLELRCTDLDLNAEKVANEFAMSLRALHQLFEPSGSTFHEELTEARLRKAHALLGDAANAQLSTADIGFAAGFRETSTFYRRFRQRFGVTPGEMRGS